MEHLASHLHMSHGKTETKAKVTDRRTPEEVLRFIDHQLPESIALEGFVADFKVALWKALKDRFPGTSIQGCLLQWTRAVFRKVQEHGRQRGTGGYGDIDPETEQSAGKGIKCRKCNHVSQNKREVNDRQKFHDGEKKAQKVQAIQPILPR
uniref:Uncharacterized protein n=1 Tax=Magallana gigas TaxID=29159 RepID=K1R5R5_MAGGI